MDTNIPCLKHNSALTPLRIRRQPRPPTPTECLLNDRGQTPQARPAFLNPNRPLQYCGMHREPRPRRIMLIVVLSEGGLGLVAWLLVLLFDLPLFKISDWHPAAVLWGVLATVPLLVGLLLLSRFRRGPLERLWRLVEQLVADIFGGATVAELALVSLLAGVGEEILFRAALQGALSSWFGWPTALIVASLLFGVAHLITKTYAVLATLVGLYLGGLWIYFDNLLVPIVVHALYDFLALNYLLHHKKSEHHPTDDSA